MAKMVWQGRVVMDQLNAGAARGLGMAADHLLTEGTKTIPFDEGTMARDGQTSLDGSALVATVFYDGPSNPYVVKQHEELTYRHSEGRRAKWLELTGQEQAGAINQIIADEIRKAHQG